MDQLPKSKLYTVSEAAGYLGISVNTLKRWEEKGKILVGRTPTGIRVYKKEDLDRIKGTFDPGSQISVQPSAPTPVKQASSGSAESSAPLPQQYKTLFLALFGLLILFATTSIILFQYSTLPHQAVLGVETFLGPALEESAPLGNFFSRIGNIFKGGSLVVPLLGKSELETPADLNVQGKASIAKDIEGLGNLKIKGTATVSKLITPVVDPYLIENDGAVQSTLEIRSTGDISLEPGTGGSGNVVLNGSSLRGVNNLSSNNSTIGGNLSLSSTTPTISIGDTGSLKITDGTNTLLTLSDAGTIGNLNVSGTIQSSNISEGAKVSGTNTGDQTITLTGDVTGSGTGSFATTLGTSGVTAASYGSTTAIPVLTVDSKGRITAATTAAISSSWSSITNPTTNLSLTMASNTSTFTYNAATGASTNLFTLTDTTSNTGTGYLLSAITASSSNLKPFQVQARGNAIIDTTAAGILTLGNTTANQNVQFFSSSNSITPSGALTLAGGVTAGGVITAPNGSASAPSIAFTNSTGTGIYRAGTDILGVSTAGSQRIQVDASGNVTINGNTTLTVNGNVIMAGQAAPSVSSAGQGKMYFDSTANKLEISQNASAYQGINDQPQPNLVLNSDFGRRNKWMTFMPEVFSDTSGWTVQTGSLGTVSGNILTAGTAGAWRATAGLSTWKDGRFSAQTKILETTGGPGYGVGRWQDANNFIETRWSGSNFEISKVIGGVRTQVVVVSQAVTLNHWAWFEIEFQGTTVVAKIYDSGTSPVAKSSATLLNTISGTVSSTDAPSGNISIHTDGSPTIASQWGGLATGDGGVYVEGWGPEGWDVTYSGTKGGQAIGLDETTNAGPLGKQWAMAYYIPASDRNLRFQRQSTAPSASQIKPSTAYTLSSYMKVANKGGTGNLVYVGVDTDVANDKVNVTDSGETSWTRKTASAYTTTASETGLQFSIRINQGSGPNFTGGSATGTGYVDLPQLEEGSVATPWRNAPADDDPIIFSVSGPNSTITSSGTSFSETDSRDHAIDAFFPYDTNLVIHFQSIWDQATAGINNYIDVYLDGSVLPGGAWTGFTTAGVNSQMISVTATTKVAAGKHRIAMQWSEDVGGGNRHIYAFNGTNGILTTTATRGKFDLAEEYTVNDSTIGAGDVVQLASKQSLRSGDLNNSQVASSATIERSAKGYSSSVLGIVSSDPGVTLGNFNLNGNGTINSEQSYQDRYTRTNLRPVALSGRVPVKVTNENGDIHRGDTLTSSDKYPGYAMKATKAGRSIGVAMEDFAPALQENTTNNPISNNPIIQFGKIMTFVNLSWYDPDVYLTDSGQFVINKAVESTTVQLASNGQVATASAIPNSQFTISNSQTKETVDRVGAFNNLFVANLRVGSLDVSSITNVKLTDIEQRLRKLELATDSAVLSSSISALLSNEPISSSSAILSTLTVQNKTILNDLGITGTITNGLLSIDGLQSSISSLSDIKLKVPGGQVTIDKDGNIVVSNKITAQKIEADIFSSTKASGSSVLPANTASVDVNSQNATDSAKILVTPTTLTDKVLTVTQKIVGKFTVSVKVVEPQDIHFDWFIIN